METHTMNYEDYEKKLIAELDILMESTSMEDLQKRFFKNHGCLNMLGDDGMHEVALARQFHSFHKRLHPEMHEMHETEPYRCYHVSSCKCGFSTACDSSD